MRKLRTVGLVHIYNLEDALGALRRARIHTQAGGARQAIHSIRRAIKSTEGALRHAIRAQHSA